MMNSTADLHSNENESSLEAYLEPWITQIRTQGYINMIIPPGTPGATEYERVMNFCAGLAYIKSSR